MAFVPRHGSASATLRTIAALPGQFLHLLSDTIGWGNLKNPLDLVIVYCLTFLLISAIGYVVLIVSGAPFNEETKRTACLYLPMIAAPLPGLFMNNRHRLVLAMDRLLLTGDILHVHPKLSTPQAYRIGGKLMAQIKQAVGCNRRPACSYMKYDYPTLMAQVIERVHLAATPLSGDGHFI